MKINSTAIMVNGVMILTLAIVLTTCPYTMVLVAIPASIISMFGMPVLASIPAVSLIEALIVWAIARYAARKYI